MRSTIPAGLNFELLISPSGIILTKLKLVRSTISPGEIGGILKANEKQSRHCEWNGVERGNPMGLLRADTLAMTKITKNEKD